MATNSLLVPPAKEVRERLSVAVRETEILRQLLRVAEKAERDLGPAKTEEAGRR